MRLAAGPSKGRDWNEGEAAEAEEELRLTKESSNALPSVESSNASLLRIQVTLHNNERQQEAYCHPRYLGSILIRNHFIGENAILRFSEQDLEQDYVRFAAFGWLMRPHDA